MPPTWISVPHSIPLRSRLNLAVRSRNQRPRMLFALLHTRASSELATFHYQQSLPRLPLPPLRNTLDKYLQSLEPYFILNERNGRGRRSEARARRRKLADEFEQGLGVTCQQRLQELVKNAPYNWLDDAFWLRKAYLESRSSLLVQSNWWLALQDDETVPASVRLDPQPELFNEWQLRRASWLVKRMLSFKDRLDQERIPPDLVRTVPLCMSHYKRMFNMTRIPAVGCDILHKASTSNPSAHQIVVFANGNMFLVDAYESNGTFSGTDLIYRRLKACARLARSRPNVAVAILTVDDRDKWAKNRDYLMQLSPRNRLNLWNIDSSLFCLSLESTRSRLQNETIADSVTNPRWDDHLHNTAYGRDGQDRWLDKTITISLESNTRFGMMGEHSPCDALVPSILGDYCVEEPINLSEFSVDNLAIPEEGDGWKSITWDIDSYITDECRRVAADAKALVDDSDDSQLWFEDYGVNWIKQVAKLSPDAYIQMALQMAWIKDQGRPTAVYETASTRLFLHGRTEVIRSLSQESLAFVQSMNDEISSPAERLRLLMAAIKAHNTYTRDASTGQGIDRHLMALRLVMAPGESSELFQDELFAQSQEWKLSTSGLSSGDRFIGTGFGSPYPDGYGINYLAGGEILKFGIESKHSCPTTSTLAFKHALVASLREMRTTCEKGYIELERGKEMTEGAIQARL